MPLIMPPDDLPPKTPDKIQSYPEGLAVSADGKTLAAALNLSDRVAVIDTASRSVAQVPVRSDTRPGDRAMPLGVAIAGRTAYVTDEADGPVNFSTIWKPPVPPSNASSFPLGGRLPTIFLTRTRQPNTSQSRPCKR